MKLKKPRTVNQTDGKTNRQKRANDA